MGVFIRDVESIVGLSKKNIRYYEEVGLINPRRDDENDYRIYNDEDIRRLKIIKFFRELDVPIREIKMICKGEMSIRECMEDRINKIEKEEEKLKKIKSMCLDIAEFNDTFDSIDITKYFEEINILSKEGFTMRDVQVNKSRKIRGAILSSLVFSLFFLALSGMVTYFQFTEAEKMPWFLFWFVVFLLLIPVFGIVYNLVIRINEIDKGEEDEASKY